MKFNLKLRNKGKTKNHEGAPAFVMTPELELYSAVVTASLSGKFYETSGDRVARIRELISKVDPTFVAKLAVYAREKMYLRSVPLLLAAELAKVHKGDALVSKLVDRIVQRADEITEMLGAYQMVNQRTGQKKLNKLSKQVQKGLANAFNRFDEYQFAKYNRDADIKLRDALFLVHPKANSEAQQTLFDKIASNTLQAPETWEVKLSRAGQKQFAGKADKQKAFAEQWESMLRSGKLGYMALVRNLRNLLENEVSDEALELAANRLRNRTAVLRSKQFPFRFLAAYRQLKQVASPNTSLFLDALEDAITISAANLPGFGKESRVMIAVDMSGSMGSPVSAKSSVKMYEVGLILAMLLQNRCAKVETGIFGHSHKLIGLPRKGILANADGLANRIGEVGHSTNGFLVIKDLIKRKVVVDKVMIFTDMQLWNDSPWGVKENTIAALWPKYKLIAPDARLYLFDLQGYGQTPLRLKGTDVFMVAGWSEKVFEVMQAIEQGSDALSEIKAIDL